MDSSSSLSGSLAYLESLRRAGQLTMKRFDDALASTMGARETIQSRDARVTVVSTIADGPLMLEFRQAISGRWLGQSRTAGSWLCPVSGIR